MRRDAFWLGAALLACAVIAHGQSYTAPGSYTDAQAVAANAPALANLASQMPTICPGAPAADTLNGSGGSGCAAPGNATRPTPVQSGNTVTDASGNFAVTFGRTFVSTVPFVRAEPQASTASAPMQCNWTTRSATGFSGFCVKLVTTILGGSLTALLNAVISPFAPAAANIAVTWAAREPTQ